MCGAERLVGVSLQRARLTGVDVEYWGGYVEWFAIFCKH